ncbi:alpha/beta fold hydrolase [Amycolatopsis sp. RM579]|uniref:Alpha/beta fold hydrolase n=2 Tax=Amycolatopsis pithecellobii TaxID=664692 RepID=A0A6N7Z4W9_9PSEU|nr:alpha/beta fold hydrolase [Amycolatopsis pithecellobii]
MTSFLGSHDQTWVGSLRATGGTSTHGVIPFPGEIDPGHHGVRSIMYSRPGYGASTPKPGRTPAEAAGDVAAILDCLGVNTFVTAGWSGGAPHALACAALLPGRCRATAVLGGIGPYDRHQSFQDTFMLIDEVRPAMEGDWEGYDRALADAAASVLGIDVHQAIASLPSQADKDSVDADLADWLVDSLASGYLPTPAGVRDDYLAFLNPWGFDVADSRNVAVWHGSDDHIPLIHPQWISDHAPEARLHILPGEGHFSMLRHLPEIVADLLSRAADNSR